MVRKQVYIEERQEALLKQRARALGVTEAELIRRGIDRTLTEAGGPPGGSAWPHALEVMRRRRRLTGRPRRWRREELYDGG